MRNIKNYSDFIINEDTNTWEQPEPVSSYDAWVIPNEGQLKLEYKIECVLKGQDWFSSEEDFLEKVKDAKVVEISKEMDNNIWNRSETQSYEDLLSLIKNYNSYPEFRNEKTLQNLYNRISNNQELDMPIVLKFLDNGRMRIFSENTRMDVAYQMGVNPKVLMVEVD